MGPVCSENFLKYERYFETPFDLLLVPGISRRQKLAIYRIWHERRTMFLYTHFHERSWEMDDIIFELEICCSLLEDTNLKSVFRNIYHAQQSAAQTE